MKDGKEWDIILQIDLPEPAIRFLEQLAEKIKKEIQLSNAIDIADIGCGRGELIHSLARKLSDRHFEGYDLSVDAISQLKKEALPNEEFHDLVLPEVPHRTFDLIYSINTLHYIPESLLAIQRLWTLVKPGGKLIFNYPNTYYASLLPPEPQDESWAIAEDPMRKNINLLTQKQIRKVLPGAKQRLLHKSGNYNIYLIFERLD